MEAEELEAVAANDDDVLGNGSSPMSNPASSPSDQQQQQHHQNATEAATADDDDDDDDDNEECSGPPDDSPSLSDDLYGDDVSDMTYGRRIARYLSRYSWYYPYEKQEAKYREAAAARARDIDFEDVHGDAHDHTDDDGCERDAEGGHIVSFRDIDEDKPPVLDAAWAYFEHVGTLLTSYSTCVNDFTLCIFFYRFYLSC